MSRCFPFPPPGYEGKHKPEDLDLLKEAKQREKKHKKEKKDKERKKDKEKDKDGGDEKCREKKDRKEKHKDKKDKHKDKKKDKKDRVKEKEKSSTSEESTVAGKVQEQSGGKLHSKGHGKDSNLPVFHSQNGGIPLPSQSSRSSQGIEDSKFVQELDRRIRNEKQGRGSQLPEKVTPPHRKDQETAAARGAGRNSSAVQTEAKDGYNNKRIDRTSEYSGDTLVPNVTVMSQSNAERISRPVDEQNSRRLQDKEKYKETSDINHRHKQRDKESLGKEKKRQDGAKLKSENKKSEPSKAKDVVRNNLDGVFSNSGQGLVLLNEFNNNAIKVRKRKETDTNGFLHENEIRPNKMQKPVPPHQENGRKPEGFRTPTKPPNDKHNIQVDKRDQLANGRVEPPASRPSPSKPNSSVPGDQIAEALKLPPHYSKSLNKAKKVPEIEDQIAEASRRPSHHDSKYLTEILSVPEMANWPGIDDQDWLFSKKGPSNKPKAEPTKVLENPCVWSEAVHIESADICALPYVIPY